MQQGVGRNARDEPEKESRSTQTVFRRRSKVAARRVRRRIRSVMDRAVAMEYVDLQPGWGRHQRRPCQAAPCQGPHPALPYRDLPPALQTVWDSGASPSGEAGLSDAGPDGLPLRGGPGHDLG